MERAGGGREREGRRERTGLERQLNHEDRRASELDSAETFGGSERGELEDGEGAGKPQKRGGSWRLCPVGEPSQIIKKKVDTSRDKDLKET